MKLYTVVIGGIAHVMQLDESDAKRLGVTETKAAEPPKNKADRAPANKGA